MSPLRPLEWGLPVSASRNTDIPKFWMRRWFEWVDRGWVNAPHPQTGLPAQWSLKPEDMHSIIWWSKDYRPFLKHARRPELDTNYRQFFNMTITGDVLWEEHVPDLDVQLDTFEAMVAAYGVQKLRWRYSPIPLDWRMIEKITKRLAGLGVTECYFSYLHSGAKIQEPRDEDTKARTLLALAEYLNGFGMSLYGCWDDVKYARSAPNIFEAKCVDADVVDRLYGLEKYRIKHPNETSCGCSSSIEVANQTLLACPHACTYCYASPK